MANRDIVVIGASAGGLQALLELLAPLPIDLPAAILVVVHTGPTGSGLLPEIVERSAAWRTHYAEDGDEIEHGRVYLAPPDRHLLVKRCYVRVTRGPRENRFRPAVDPLFRTAAQAYGPRVVGVVLSGGLDDGTHGLGLIKQRGGIAISQDPQTAVMPSMPLSAIQNVEVDHILSPGAIGAKLPFLVREEVTDNESVHPERADMAEGLRDTLQTGHIPGPPSPYTCPECGGALWELAGGRLLRFRCHLGHGFTADALASEQADNLEQILWGGLRALEEHAALCRRMAAYAESVGRWTTARAFDTQANEVERRAATLRRLLRREEQRASAQMLHHSTAANGKRNGHSRPRRAG